MNPSPAKLLVACAREAGSGCPYCSAEIAIGDPIMVCQACGTVHHRTCWNQNARCGSYSCAPARRDVTDAVEPVISISLAEIDRAVPLPPRRPVMMEQHAAIAAAALARQRPEPSPTRTNGLAIAALVCGLAGIPFVGIPGLVAMLLGALALGAIRGTAQKGMGLALGGLLLGIADVVGWIIFVGIALSHPSGAVDVEFGDFQPDVAATKDLDPTIRRAMLANVLIERRSGLRALGGLAIGSGVILNEAQGEAVIVTNRHVVDPNFSSKSGDPGKLGTVLVKMIGHPTGLTGRVVWMAPDGIDLALVRIPWPANCQARPAKWAKARPEQVGADVFAIGNPHHLDWSHTKGVISQFRIQKVGGRQVRLIQTQAAINPGNSGGGLYDRAGFLIGINTLTQDKRVSEGISFAIALDTLFDLSPPDLSNATSAPDDPPSEPEPSTAKPATPEAS